MKCDVGIVKCDVGIVTCEIGTVKSEVGSVTGEVGTVKCELGTCLFVLRFYGPLNPMGSCRARSVYLTTLLLGRLSPLSG